MHSYFPPIQPYATYRLPVQAPHEIYVEECGNPQGLPVLFLHGGPGSGCSEDSRRFFDPTLYRIVLFDQRGSGRSTPHAELSHNTTADLLADIEAIRSKLNIDRWVVFGGSWGSTLALVYAQAHPQHVLAMILRGIWLGSNADRDWLYTPEGAARFFPDYWEDFLAPLPADQRHNLMYEYYELLTSDDEVARMRAAETWTAWEAKCAKLNIDPSYVEAITAPHNALSVARLECHYFINNCFIEPNQILSHMDRLQHIPAIILHGRYDMVCLLDNAWKLHKAWPKSKLFIVPNSGHSATEPEMLNALILATEKIAGDFVRKTTQSSSPSY